MISRDLLKTVVLDQQKDLILGQEIITRILPKDTLTPIKDTAMIIKGIRRCGKSTLLKQSLQKLSKPFFYLNFDDERLIGFDASDFQVLMEVFLELFGACDTVLFDEIQNISGWELFVNRILREKYFVFITGSNAHLLSKGLGTHLTGRHLDHELFPFSFSEYAAINGKTFSEETFFDSQKRAECISLFENYLVDGGMPEVVRYHRKELLGQTFEDIVQKDILKRYALRKPTELRTILQYLLGVTSRSFTFSSLTKHFGVKSNFTTKKYVQCAEEVYLIFTTNKYEKKMRLLDKNPKKIYCVDNGLVLRYSGSANIPKGALLENLVALELRRKGLSFFYYVNKNSTETDFVIVDSLNQKKTIRIALQVCFDPSDFQTMEREERALFQTMKEQSLSCTVA